ncbi:pisatin demethylase cytochrome P450 [Fusarium tjaetaba]|uniref:Pisatin demethylase cytochrome P450 n=1 Tax=Fusarium tjaetaba TaxID=1567544 RepID=A0A8H5QM41_9HYPO|nr:pisatin demethylase cytochrome P450 [Fusarium tjaetaba]KAF5617234.1 pisatin demethylase cytochrome P450 [Fusarium tjaetaba]
MYPTSLAIGTGALSGALAHALIFRKGEWDLYTIKILQGLLTVTGVLALSFKRLGATEDGSSYSLLESIIASIYMPAISLHMSRDKNDHSRRRRAWDRAFSSKVPRALRDYEPRVVKYTSQLLDRLEQTQDIPIDIAKWFKFYSFDTMGDLAFGKSFNMLTDGVKHPFMALVESHMAMAGAFSQLIWMFPLFRAMPFLGQEDAIFQKWLENQVRHQEQNKPDLPNIFSWLLEDYKSQLHPREQDWLNLQADMQLIAVAGSDTTSVTLTCLFYLLAANKGVCIRLQEEIDNLFSSFSQPNHSSFSKLTYLQACIDETLRLFPPVPSGLQRMTPAEGLRVGDIFIPGDTIVTVPSYTLYRDERYFTSPDDFVPERWTIKPEMVMDDSVFAPFSVGRYACVGKQLGLMEVGYASCMILHRFDICFAGEENASKSAFLTGLRDHFTLDAPQLKFILTARKE